jgi:hypothetical protein
MNPATLLPERLAIKVVVSEVHYYNGTPCCDWQGKLEANGYAKISWNGKWSWLHRVVCELTHGESGSVTEHKCNRRCCISPLHLEPSTFKAKTAYKFASGRLSGCVAKHVYTN